MSLKLMKTVSVVFVQQKSSKKRFQKLLKLEQK
ncbi:Uncharacterised protein [Mycobacterium tuberculosis]|nr:Uncharacterised protein [Mycobacterium tuberculosis]